MNQCTYNTNPTRHTHLYSAVIPALVLGSLTAYNLWEEHWEHWDHMPPLEERTEYPYQNIRVKNFPWKDGDKVCLIPGLNLITEC